MISECLVVEFEVTGDGCPLADASAAVDGTVDAAPPLLRRDGYTLLRVSTTAEGLDATLQRDDRIRYLHHATADGRETFRCLSKEPCVVHRLIDQGFLVESIRYEGGRERHVGAVVGLEVLRGVMSAAGDAGVELVGMSPLGEEGERPVAGRWGLTPAQAEALRRAHERGYFEVPKGATAAEVAADIGVSKSAFVERLRRAEAAVFGKVFD
jgi:predicted DNA binding protein